MDALDFLDGIHFDIAKQKYYNANKVDAKMAEIREVLAGLVSENESLRSQLDGVGLSKERIAEIIVGAQDKADEIVANAEKKAAELIKSARLEADGIKVGGRAEAGGGAPGLSPAQLAAIDRLNKQLDGFNVAQATQIFRIKQALMSIALSGDSEK